VENKMKTVKEFKDLDGKFVYGDAGSNYKVRDEVAFNSRKIWDDNILESFAWRPLNTLPDNPKFKYEVNTTPHQWRPLLDQPVDIYACDDCYDNSEITIKYVDALKPVNGAAVKPSDDKPVFTQAMADAGYLPPVGSDFLHAKKVVTCLSVSDYDGGVVTFAYKDRDSHEPDIACCWNNEVWVKPIDTRTPKQKAVDEMMNSLSGYCKEQLSEGLLREICQEIEDIGYEKKC